MDEDEKPLTLSREDLYELAWSKPMSSLAEDFGISDVALAKRCKRLHIPVPGRGYWARVGAGQTPHRPKLPSREPEWRDQEALTVAPSVGAYSATILSSQESRQTLNSLAPESVPARIAALVISPTASIGDAVSAVKRTAVHEKHPRRSQLTFARGEKKGAIVAVDVTPESLDRTLLLADAVLRAAEEFGWEFGDPATLRKKQGLAAEAEAEPQTQAAERGEKKERFVAGRLLVEGEQVAVRIEERLREERVLPSPAQLAREKRDYGYHAPRKVSVPTGALRLVRLDTYRSWGQPDRRSWYDRKGKRVEEQIPEVLLGFYELALSIKERRKKDEREAREREAAQRRREERAAIQEANQKLIAQLERDAGAWHRARYLRRYLASARRQLGDRVIQARFREESVNFLDWAEAYVNQLDPLHADLRSGEFEESPTYHFRNDLDRMKEAFGRLLGADWPDAWKVSRDYRPESKSAYSFGEKSVFEIREPNSGDDPAED